MRQAPKSRFHQPAHYFPQTFGMGKDVIQAGDFMLLFLFGFVEQDEVFLAAVEVKPANGFAVVIVEEDGEIGLAIAVMNAVYRHRFAQYALYNEKAFRFLDAGLVLYGRLGTNFNDSTGPNRNIF